MSIKQRLGKLEQMPEASRGIRVFIQSEDNPTIFYEDGHVYSAAEISALAADGWLCIKVVYGGGA